LDAQKSKRREERHRSWRRGFGLKTSHPHREPERPIEKKIKKKGGKEGEDGHMFNTHPAKIMS